MSEYVLTLLTFALVFGALAVSYNLSVGFVGLLSVSHAAFFAVGAYAYGILATAADTGSVFPLALGVGGLVAALIAVTLGLLLIALPEQYVIIGTFALQVTFTTVLMNWSDLTAGVQGITGIPGAVILRQPFESGAAKLVLAAALAVFSLGVAWAILHSRLGIVARAARDEPDAAAAIGIAVRPVRVCLFTMGAVLASAAGAVYASVIGYIDPSSFTIETSIQVLSMVVIGGAGSPVGAFIGGVVIALLPAALQELSLATNAAAAIQQIVFGVAMVVMIVFRPSGLFPERRLLEGPATKA